MKHDKRGILSMARHDDPNSGKSSFSILLGPAPHLDMQYTVFGCALASLTHHFSRAGCAVRVCVAPRALQSAWQRGRTVPR